MTAFYYVYLMTGETIPAAVRVLNDGGLVIYPTETCYALGADATNPAAVLKVFKAKNRPLDQPLSVIVSSLEMIKEYAIVTREVERLINEFMPGPLTLIVKNKKFPQALCGGGVTVGFRIPDNVIALELVKQFGKPIVATSANLHGGPNPYEVPSVNADFVINAGALPRRSPSTVYDTLLRKTVRFGDVKV